MSGQGHLSATLYYAALLQNKTRPPIGGRLFLSDLLIRSSYLILSFIHIAEVRK